MNFADQAVVLDESPQPTKRMKPQGTPEERQVEEFREAYKALFFVYPTVQLNNGFYRVTGYADAMTIKRLRELTRQLKKRLASEKELAL